ncbi:hypothetical protein C8J47_2923 [Sphingomonas sp. PP-F2F-G114-C0414]|uniref:hypothetical protein n=1 Tax=Sphingomonas sp. PP-F2F-G114-C0414 TaxID=2135662 RepID=UPI000EF95C61|nr:hypothetical protein [Sphingomonas sp. PP-F2F-G114-C0414]RMB28695.1 hypothetical protein C8J47_2923 [Sphingomonas sp. PP-F2F-G114-C0414]
MVDRALLFAKHSGDNTKAWVAAHRGAMHAARDDHLALEEDPIDRANEYDPEIASVLFRAVEPVVAVSATGA